MRVRSFTNRGSTTKVIGKFPSLKNDTSVWWESQIERDFIYLLEFDNEVLSYQEQPLRIQYVLNGRIHYYTPDFLVRRGHRKQIIEVKPEAKASSEFWRELFSAVASVFHQDGYEFLVATDNIIRIQPRLNNIKLLWRYARTTISPQHRVYCNQMLRDRDQIELKELIQFFAYKNVGEQVVYALLYWGYIETNLMCPINPHSIINKARSNYN